LVSIPFVKPHSPSPRSKGVRDDATDAWLRGNSPRWREEDVARAKAMAQMDAQRAWSFCDCASLVEYGRLLGLCAQRTRAYAAAGRAMEACPEAEQLVLDGRVCFMTLAAAAPLFTDGRLCLRDAAGEPRGASWTLNWLKDRTEREVRSTLHKLREELRVGAQTEARTIYLSSGGVGDLERTQTLLGRRKERVVSQSEAVQHTLRDWLSRNDPLETKPGTRRTPPMHARSDGTRNPRGLPAEVERALMSMHGDRCAIEGCDHHIWLQNAHKTPHALGGGNEREDLIRLCVIHHAMWDHGEMRWVADDSYPCGGYFETLGGRILRLRQPLLPDADARPVTDDAPPEAGDRVKESTPRLVPSRGPRVCLARRRPAPRGGRVGKRQDTGRSDLPVTARGAVGGIPLPWPSGG
jgi:hypothetical protein